MTLRVVFFFACLAVIEAKLTNLTCKNIRQFVDGHNSRRLLLAQGQVPGQPAASDMQFMIWDDELAAKAAHWASREIYQHNPDKTVASKRFRTGENLYIYSTTNFHTQFDVTLALNRWWDEHNDFHYKKLDSSDFGGPSPVGHYTQMAWADTTYMGCAISNYRSGRWNQFLVVCNYGPAGNYLGQEPYPQGKPVGRLDCPGNCNRPYGKRC